MFGSQWEEFLERLDLVLTAIEDAGLTINPRKCVFATDRVFHLGHIIDRQGLRPNPEKVRALAEMPVKNVKTLRSFIGVASFFRKFVSGFATIGQPLFRLLKKNVKWSWGKEEEEAKNPLVKLLTNAPVLAHFNDELEVTVQTDASQEGLGAVLLQNDGEGLRPILYISLSFSDAEKTQHCNELECLALVWALEKFRPYLYGKKFKVEMDRSAVKWLLNKNQMGKFGRWILALQEYDFEIRHIRGVTNCVADGLSRSLLVDTTDGFSSTEVICTFVSKFNLPFGLLQPIPPPSNCFESVVVDHLGPFKQTARGGHQCRHRRLV